MKKILIFIFVILSMTIFSQEVPIPGNLVPSDPADAYHLLDDIYVKGGLTIVETLAIRDDADGLLNPSGITTQRREEGMLCYVTEEGKWYQLQGGVLNANWVEIKLASSLTLELATYVFDTIRLTDNDTKIWRFRLSNDTLYYNDQIFVSTSSGSDLPTIDADRPLNLLSNGTNVATLLGRTNVRLDSLVTAVFYAAQNPGASVTGTGDTYVEYGHSVNVTVTWTATKTTNPITAITFDGDPVVPTGNTQTASPVLALPTNTNKTYTLLVEESTGLTATDSKSYYYRNRLYVDIDPLAPVPDDAYYDGITNADIYNDYQYDDLRTSYFGSAQKYSISNPDGARIIVVVPSSFGVPYMWIEGGNPDYAGALTLVREWSFVNKYGYSTTYRMYVSSNQFNANPLNFYIRE